MNWKLILGVLLICPAIFCGLAYLGFRFSNPHLTDIEAFNQIGWLPLISLVPFLGGCVLLGEGMYDEE